MFEALTAAVLIAAGALSVGAQIPAVKAPLAQVGPAIDAKVAGVTGGRLDPRNYTYDANGKPVAFNAK